MTRRETAESVLRLNISVPGRTTALASKAAKAARSTKIDMYTPTPDEVTQQVSVSHPSIKPSKQPLVVHTPVARSKPQPAVKIPDATTAPIRSDEADLKARITKAEVDFAAARRDVTEKTAKVAELESKIEELALEAEKHQASAKSDASKARAELEDCKSKLESNRTDLDKAASRASALHTEVSELQSRIESQQRGIQAELERLQAAQREANNAKDVCESNLQASRTEIARISAELQNATQQNEERGRQLLQSQQELEACTAAKIRLNMELSAAQSSKVSTGKRLATAEKQVVDCQHRITHLQRESAAALNTNKTDKQELERSLATTQRELTNLKQLQTNLSATLAVERERVANLTAENDNAISEESKAKADYNILRSECEAQKELIAQLQDSKATSESTTHESQRTLRSLEEKLRVSEESLLDAKAKLNTAQNAEEQMKQDEQQNLQLIETLKEQRATASLSETQIRESNRQLQLELQSALSNLVDAKREADAARDAASAAEAARLQVEQTLATQTQIMQVQAAQALDVTTELYTKQAASEAQYERQLQDLEQRAVQAQQESESNDAKVTQLTLQLTQAKEERDDCISQKSEAANNHSASITALKRENENIRQTQASRLAQSEHQRIRSEAEEKLVLQSLEEVKRAAQATTEKLQQQTYEANAKQRELDESKRLAAELQAELRVKEEEVDKEKKQAQADLEHCRVLNSTWERQLAEQKETAIRAEGAATAALNEKQARVSQLEQQLTQATAIVEELEKSSEIEINKLKDDIKQSAVVLSWAETPVDVDVNTVFGESKGKSRLERYRNAATRIKAMSDAALLGVKANLRAKCLAMGEAKEEIEGMSVRQISGFARNMHGKLGVEKEKQSATAFLRMSQDDVKLAYSTIVSRRSKCFVFIPALVYLLSMEKVNSVPFAPILPSQKDTRKGNKTKTARVREWSARADFAKNAFESWITRMQLPPWQEMPKFDLIWKSISDIHKGRAFESGRDVKQVMTWLDSASMPTDAELSELGLVAEPARLIRRVLGAEERAQIHDYSEEYDWAKLGKPEVTLRKLLGVVEDAIIDILPSSDDDPTLMSLMKRREYSVYDARSALSRARDRAAAQLQTTAPNSDVQGQFSIMLLVRICALIKETEHSSRESLDHRSSYGKNLWDQILKYEALMQQEAKSLGITDALRSNEWWRIVTPEPEPELIQPERQQLESKQVRKGSVSHAANENSDEEEDTFQDASAVHDEDDEDGKFEDTTAYELESKVEQESKLKEERQQKSLDVDAEETYRIRPISEVLRSEPLLLLMPALALALSKAKLEYGPKDVSYMRSWTEQRDKALDVFKRWFPDFPEFKFRDIHIDDIDRILHARISYGEVSAGLSMYNEFKNARYDGAQYTDVLDLEGIIEKAKSESSEYKRGRKLSQLIGAENANVEIPLGLNRVIALTDEAAGRHGSPQRRLDRFKIQEQTIRNTIANLDTLKKGYNQKAIIRYEKSIKRQEREQQKKQQIQIEKRTSLKTELPSKYEDNSAQVSESKQPSVNTKDEGAPQKSTSFLKRFWGF